jgi:serine/threonine protein kinase
LFPGFADVVEIGRGTLATVYSAREVETNRRVALKLLNARDVSARAIESFERESLSLGAVSSHPNIVTLFRIFRAVDGRPVLVLELCRGPISERIRQGEGMPVAEVLSIGIKIAGALETAHRVEILHRGVKPENILITEFGEPALADFGVAKLQSSTQTTAGLFDFTTVHAAPELLEGGPTSATTDVYELGSSLYQLIAGRSAFREEDGESPASVILRILRDPVKPLLNANVPPELSDLLISAMSKDRESRPPTAAEFARRLSSIEAAQGWPPTPFVITDARDSLPPERPALPAHASPASERTAIRIDEEPLDHAEIHYPIPPAGSVSPPVVSEDVPTWASRRSSPAASDAPASAGDRRLDPLSLRRRATLRAAGSTVVADDTSLRVRRWWRHREIAWSDIKGFEMRFDRAAARYGHLVVVTTDGPVHLFATKRPVGELPDLQALLDAYLRRAQLLGSL